MADMAHWLSGDMAKSLGLILIYPILVLAALGVARKLGGQRSVAAEILRQAAYLLLPFGAIWLILRYLAGLPPQDNLVRTAATAFALTGLFILLRIAQSALMAVLGSEKAAPRLLLDILRIGLSAIWSAVAISIIWDVDLGQMFAALGVGSVVLGFALQEFVGNLLSGLVLMSSKKFGIGDSIIIDGAAARVIEMDWHTVVLTRNGRDRIVVANSTLAKQNLVIPAQNPATIEIALAFGVDIPPELIRAAARDVGAAAPDLPVAGVHVTGIAEGLVNYKVKLPVASTGSADVSRDEFLSRFWYLAQRRGLRLEGAAEAADEAERRRMLEAAGAFRGEADVLARIARRSAFQRYRRGETLLQLGAPAKEAFLVLTGALAVTAPNGEGEIRVELVGPDQLFVLIETLSGGASPVRVTIDQDADLIAIPAATLIEVIEHHSTIARDVGALAEARRLAIHPLQRGFRAVS